MGGCNYDCQAKSEIVFSLLASGEIGQTYADAAENESLREWGNLFICGLLRLVFFFFFITFAINIVGAPLDPKLKVEELL